MTPDEIANLKTQDEVLDYFTEYLMTPIKGVIDGYKANVIINYIGEYKNVNTMFEKENCIFADMDIKSPWHTIAKEMAESLHGVTGIYKENHTRFFWGFESDYNTILEFENTYSIFFKELFRLCTEKIQELIPGASKDEFYHCIYKRLAEETEKYTNKHLREMDSDGVYDEYLEKKKFIFLESIESENFKDMSKPEKDWNSQDIEITRLKQHIKFFTENPLYQYEGK